jgi:DNA-binding beta-propeller fold protein YncE
MLQLLLLCVVCANYNPQTLAVPPFKHTFGFYRASKYYLQLFLGPGYDYDDPQGIVVVKLKEHDDPKTSRDDDELTAFAVNSGRDQIVYNIGLEAVKLYGNDKMFSQLKGITANEDGLVAIADFGNKRIVKLQYEGGRLHEAGFIPMDGRPYDVCFDSQNNLYVTDHDNSKICIFDTNDSLIMKFGIEGKSFGELFQPMGIEVIDEAAPYNHHRDDFIVVTDKYGLRLSKFSRAGRFIGSVQSSDIGLADAGFLYTAVDFFGSIYVTDEVNDQVHKFDHNLRYIISVGRTGTDKGEFIAPRGISIWRRYGQVFLTEKEGGQYLWIAADGFVVGCFPEQFTHERPGTTLAIYTTQDAKVYITIYNQLGEKVRDLIQGVNREPGEFLIVWDGLDNFDRLVPPGEYEFRITIKSLHGHAKRLMQELKAGVRCIAL